MCNTTVYITVIVIDNFVEEFEEILLKSYMDKREIYYMYRDNFLLYRFECEAEVSTMKVTMYRIPSNQLA